MDPGTKDSASSLIIVTSLGSSPGRLKLQGSVPLGAAADPFCGPLPGQQESFYTERLAGWLQLPGQAEVMKTHVYRLTGVLMIMMRTF